MRWLALSRITAFVLVPALVGSAQAAGDPARGADIFRQSCSACHSPEPGQNLVGPSLFSVVGRPAASIAGFSYSSAMKSSGIIWTTDELTAYLKGPRKYLPGVKMMFPGLADEQDRESVVSYLATLGTAARGSDAIASQASKANSKQRVME
jgi:cytochrome c